MHSSGQPLPHPNRDARGVVPEAFEAGQAFHVWPEVSQGVPGEVNVVRPGEEVVGTEGGGPGSGSAGGQGVGGTGRIVAERDGAEVAQGDLADGVEVPHDGLVVVRDHVRVLGGVAVGDLDGLRQVLDAYERHVPGRLAGEERLDAGDQTLARREQHGRRPGEVLGLGHQIGGNALRYGARVGDNQHLTRSLRCVDADDPEDFELRRRDVVVAWTYDLVYSRHTLCAVGECGYSLRTPHGIDLFETEQPGDGEHVGVRQSIRPRWGADPDSPHPCYLGRHRRHDERARVRGVSSRDVEPCAADGPDALRRRGPGVAALPRAVHLFLVEGAYVRYRYAEALFELR